MTGNERVTIIAESGGAATESSVTPPNLEESLVADLRQASTSTQRYRDRTDAKLDDLCRPVPLADVMARIPRSKRTIDRWIKDGRLRVIQLWDPPEKVVLLRDLVELEKEMRDALQASRDRIAAHGRARHEAAQAAKGTTHVDAD
jgi:hypothetical protein